MPGCLSAQLLKDGYDVHAVEGALRALASQPPPDPVGLASLMRNLEPEKYHRYLGRDLQCVDAASSRVAASTVPGLATELLKPFTRPQRLFWGKPSARGRKGDPR